MEDIIFLIIGAILDIILIWIGQREEEPVVKYGGIFLLIATLSYLIIPLFFQKFFCQ